MTETITLDNDIIFEDFNDHFLVEGNDRILFSAPFGTGKSTFLNQYFTKVKGDHFFLFQSVSSKLFSFSK